MARVSETLKQDDTFRWALGTFHVLWSTIELTVALGIGKFLRTTHEQTHILTAGMEFGRKATLLRNLAYRGSKPNRKQIVKIIGSLQNDAKRNVLAHGFMVATQTTVRFV